jgi:hypothetical protein
MSEYESQSAVASDEELSVSNLIKSASKKLSFEKAGRFIDRGIREMWPSAAMCLDDEDT